MKKRLAILIIVLVAIPIGYLAWTFKKMVDEKFDFVDEQIKMTDSISSHKDEMLKTTDFDYDAQFKLENYLVSNETDTSKVQTIDFDCAVLIYPTVEQIEEMKKTEGEDFYIGADDSNFYQAQASQAIDSVGIKTITAQKQFIKFVGSETWTLDIRKKNLPAWNLIFFKKNKRPQVTPTIMLTSEMVKDYFEKK